MFIKKTCTQAGKPELLDLIRQRKEIDVMNCQIVYIISFFILITGILILTKQWSAFITAFKIMLAGIVIGALIAVPLNYYLMKSEGKLGKLDFWDFSNEFWFGVFGFTMVAGIAGLMYGLYMGFFYYQKKQREENMRKLSELNKKMQEKDRDGVL